MDMHGQQILGGEARLDAVQVPKRAQSHSGAGQQDAGERHLADDQQTASALPDVAACAPSALFQRAVRSGRENWIGRSEAHQETDEKRHRAREADDAPVEPDQIEIRESRRDCRLEEENASLRRG